MTHSTKTTYPNNNHESRITRLEVTIENINETLVRFEKRFDKIDERFDKLDNRMWQMMLFMFTGFGSTLLILAKIKGWL
jgi:hypothetical protein